MYVYICVYVYMYHILISQTMSGLPLSFFIARFCSPSSDTAGRGAVLSPADLQARETGGRERSRGKVVLKKCVNWWFNHEKWWFNH